MRRLNQSRPMWWPTPLSPRVFFSPASIRTPGRLPPGACWGTSLVGCCNLHVGLSRRCPSDTSAVTLVRGLFGDLVLSCHLRLPERRIDLPGYPQVVEQNSQSSGDANHGSLP